MIDFTKPVQTRDGKPVRILCTDRKGDLPVIGLLTLSDGREMVQSWHQNGMLCNGHSVNDLINVPQRHKHADLMIAYANDPTIQIQWLYPRTLEWYDAPNPTWNSEYEYRIKPRQDT